MLALALTLVLALPGPTAPAASIPSFNPVASGGGDGGAAGVHQGGGDGSHHLGNPSTSSAAPAVHSAPCHAVVHAHMTAGEHVATVQKAEWCLTRAGAPDASPDPALPALSFMQGIAL